MRRCARGSGGRRASRGRCRSLAPAPRASPPARAAPPRRRADSTPPPAAISGCSARPSNSATRSSTSGSASSRANASGSGSATSPTRSQHVGWNLDLHWTGATRKQLAGGTVHHLWDLLRRHRPFGVLANGGDGLQLIIDLVQHAAPDADLLRLHLPGDAEHRRRASVCGGEPRRGVQQPRPGDDQAGADLAGAAGEAVGHVGGGLFVPRVHHANGVPALPRSASKAKSSWMPGRPKMVWMPSTFSDCTSAWPPVISVIPRSLRAPGGSVARPAPARGATPSTPAWGWRSMIAARYTMDHSSVQFCAEPAA